MYKELSFHEYFDVKKKDPERIEYENKLDAALEKGDKEEAHRIVSAWIHRK
jgi:hypothetical protein